MKQIFTLVVVAALAAFGGYLLSRGSMHEVSSEQAEPKEPLYWVAPMDPNFKRDAPGLSPMGMELVPVYAQDQEGSGAGVVRISPGFQHNIGVRTDKVIRGRLSDTLRTVAKVEFDENQLATVYPRVDGWLEKLHVKAVGDDVISGQPLFDIYSPTLVNAQEEYVSVLESGNRQMVASARGRLVALGIPAPQIDALGKSREVKQTVTVTSRYNGVVRELGVREGNRVSPGTRIMEIAGLDPVWVTAQVFESDIAEVALGSEMELRFMSSADLIKRANVDFIYPIIESMTRTLAVRATIPNPDRMLRPSMFADAAIMLRSEGDSLLVPVDAVIRTGKNNRVVLVEGEKSFKSVAVKIGRVGDEFIEIKEGLVEGDLVVTSAQFLIDSESSMTSDFKRLGIADAVMVDDAMNHAGMSDAEMDHSAMNHSAMNHGEMDHAEMNHAEMGLAEMDHGTMDHSQMSMDTATSARSVWATGVIRSVNAGAGTVSLAHDPIPDWQWPVMTMTMNVSGTDAVTLKEGVKYRFLLREAPDATTGYLVSDFSPQGAGTEQD